MNNTDFDPLEEGHVSGVTWIRLPLGVDLPLGTEPQTIDMKGKSPMIVEQRALLRGGNNNRKLAVFKGDKSILAVRVTVANGAPSFESGLLSDSIFGNGRDPVNMKSQFDACSYGKLNIVKAPPRSGQSVNTGDVEIYNGVTSVSLPSNSINQGHDVLRNAVTKELNRIFDVTSASELVTSSIAYLLEWRCQQPTHERMPTLTRG